MRRVLLLMPKTSYRAEDFLSAARELGVEVVKGTDRCRWLAERGAIAFEGETLVLDFKDVEGSVRKITDYSARRPIDAVIAVEDPTTLIGTRAAVALGQPHNEHDGVYATRDKLELRRRLTALGLPQARFLEIPVSSDPREAAALVASDLGFPCVLKPRSLSASRGVVRADDVDSFERACRRVAAILRDPEIRKREKDRADTILVESYVSGVEVSVEALAVAGRVEILAIFDKPDPLEGPFFEETIYVTPSRLPEELQRRISRTVEEAALGLGLRHGALHAELRVADEVVLVELAARSIGGLCSRTLRFGLGVSLEELILRQALAMEPFVQERVRGAAGVLMFPIPQTGMLLSIDGLEQARAIPGIEDLVITAEVGRELVALPEGSAYPGFAFARGERPEEVEAALRRALETVRFETRPLLPTVS